MDSHDGADRDRTGDPLLAKPNLQNTNAKILHESEKLTAFAFVRFLRVYSYHRFVTFC
jgi:hypothetical protein